MRGLKKLHLIVLLLVASTKSQDEEELSYTFENSNSTDEETDLPYNISPSQEYTDQVNSTQPNETPTIANPQCDDGDNCSLPNVFDNNLAIRNNNGNLKNDNIEISKEYPTQLNNSLTQIIVPNIASLGDISVSKNKEPSHNESSIEENSNEFDIYNDDNNEQPNTIEVIDTPTMSNTSKNNNILKDQEENIIKEENNSDRNGNHFDELLCLSSNGSIDCPLNSNNLNKSLNMSNENPYSTGKLDKSNNLGTSDVIDIGDNKSGDSYFTDDRDDPLVFKTHKNNSKSEIGDQTNISKDFNKNKEISNSNLTINDYSTQPLNSSIISKDNFSNDTNILKLRDKNHNEINVITDSPLSVRSLPSLPRILPINDNSRLTERGTTEKPKTPHPTVEKIVNFLSWIIKPSDPISVLADVITEPTRSGHVGEEIPKIDEEPIVYPFCEHPPCVYLRCPMPCTCSKYCFESPKPFCKCCPKCEPIPNEIHS